MQTEGDSSLSVIDKVNIGMGNPGVQMWTLGFVFYSKRDAQKNLLFCVRFRVLRYSKPSEIC